MGECSIGYSFDNEDVFVELVSIEDVKMPEVVEYLNEIISEKHVGKQLKDLKGLSILIK